MSERLLFTPIPQPTITIAQLSDTELECHDLTIRGINYAIAKKTIERKGEIPTDIVIMEEDIIRYHPEKRPFPEPCPDSTYASPNVWTERVQQAVYSTCLALGWSHLSYFHPILTLEEYQFGIRLSKIGPCTSTL